VGPLRLRSDNFTPASRTPWGGRRIVDVIKRGLPAAPEVAAYPVVGESWEFSVDPAFPSRLADEAGTLLSEGLPEAARTPMLVKLLDAADDLSVQVHPADGYPGLTAGQSGKSECWYVAGREPGAGIYLGLADGVDPAALAAAARAGALRELLAFVPVEPGDCFVITPGTVHAVGRGVTLVEPQLVAPGCTGVTYRLWDWGRRYDPRGRRDPAGAPRPLHLEHALEVIDFDAPRGAALAAARRRTPVSLDAAASARRERLCRLGPMAVERLLGTGALRRPAAAPGGRLGALVVLGGLVTVSGADFEPVQARAGETLALPSALGALDLALSEAEAILCECAP